MIYFVVIYVKGMIFPYFSIFILSWNPKPDEITANQTEQMNQNESENVSRFLHQSIALFHSAAQDLWVLLVLWVLVSFMQFCTCLKPQSDISGTDRLYQWSCIMHWFLIGVFEDLPPECSSSEHQTTRSISGRRLFQWRFGWCSFLFHKN